MTIGIGVMCPSGIVLGTDSQYAGRAARSALKSWFTVLGIDIGFAVVCAGKGSIIWRVKDDLERGIRSTESLQAMVADAERVLDEFYSQHRNAFAQQGEFFEVLIAFQHKRDLRVCLAEGSPVLGPIPNWACIGSEGAIIGNYFANQLLQGYRTLAFAEAVVAYIIDTAKHHDPNAGGQSHVIVLSPTNRPRFASIHAEPGVRYFQTFIDGAISLARLGSAAVLDDRKFDQAVAAFTKRATVARHEMFRAGR